MTRETLANILKEKTSYNAQTGSYVIHGAIDAIMTEHYKAINRLDDQFNAVMEVCNKLSKAAAGHKLGELNDWLDKYGTDDFKIDWRRILKDKNLLS